MPHSFAPRALILTLALLFASHYGCGDAATLPTGAEGDTEQSGAGDLATLPTITGR